MSTRLINQLKRRFSLMLMHSGGDGDEIDDIVRKTKERLPNAEPGLVATAAANKIKTIARKRNWVGSDYAFEFKDPVDKAEPDMMARYTEINDLVLSVCRNRTERRIMALIIMGESNRRIIEKTKATWHDITKLRELAREKLLKSGYQRP